MYSKTHPFNPDRLLPVIPMVKSYTSYMKVEAVLRYLEKNALALQQYKIGNEPNHFFKCSDVSAWLIKKDPEQGAMRFRSMECHVTQWMVENKEERIVSLQP